MAYSDEDLDEAVRAGILRQKDVDGFRGFIASRHHSPAKSED